MATGGKVPFERDVVSKCICGQCQVQAKSQCVKDLEKGIAEALNKTPMPREQIPNLYCATGKAACPDLDFDQNCICGDCPVFGKYKLVVAQPAFYYCRDGSAR